MEYDLEEEEEDEDSVEGHVARSLFRTDSDSNSSTGSRLNDDDYGDNESKDDDDPDQNQADSTALGMGFQWNHIKLEDKAPKTKQQQKQATSGTCSGATMTTLSTTTSSTTIIRPNNMHVQLEQKSERGQISEKLWPAAAYLATFVLTTIATARAAASDLEVTLAPTPMPPCDSSGEHKDKNNGPTVRATELLLHYMQQLLLLPSSEPKNQGFCLIELGAGIGLTGLELATQLANSKVLLTDLPVGLELLRRNVELNRELLLCAKSTVHVQKLEWGDESDASKALDWFRQQTVTSTTSTILPAASTAMTLDQPILVIGADCVYWEELHEPLERTIFSLLSQAPPGSLCLLAGMRRWKRDNSFYKSLGKRTRTTSHSLQCTCVQETVSRSKNSAGVETREIMRVYAVRYIARETEVRRR